jgi:hypothetical protein
MKTPLYLLLLVVTPIAATSLYGQADSTSIPRVELRGTLLYNTTSTPGTGYYFGETRAYTWAIQPGVGVFLYKYLAVDVECRFQRTRTESDYAGSRWEVAKTGYTSKNQIFLSAGLGCNIPVLKRIWVFGQLKAGLFWTGTGSGTGEDEDLVWSVRETVFPILQGGAKLFVSERAAVIIQLQYDCVNDEKQRTTTIGMGLAAYL